MLAPGDDRRAGKRRGQGKEDCRGGGLSSVTCWSPSATERRGSRRGRHAAGSSRHRGPRLSRRRQGARSAEPTMLAPGGDCRAGKRRGKEGKTAEEVGLSSIASCAPSATKGTCSRRGRHAGGSSRASRPACRRRRQRAAIPDIRTPLVATTTNGRLNPDTRAPLVATTTTGGDPDIRAPLVATTTNGRLNPDTRAPLVATTTTGGDPDIRAPLVATTTSGRLIPGIRTPLVATTTNGPLIRTSGPRLSRRRRGAGDLGHSGPRLSRRRRGLEPTGLAPEEKRQGREDCRGSGGSWSFDVGHRRQRRGISKILATCR